MMAEPSSPPDAPKPTGACRWPLWEHGKRPTHRFCSAPAYDFQSYCLVHRAVAYVYEAAAVAA
jgi:hypothetical protein